MWTEWKKDARWTGTLAEGMGWEEAGQLHCQQSSIRFILIQLSNRQLGQKSPGQGRNRKTPDNPLSNYMKTRWYRHDCT